MARVGMVFDPTAYLIEICDDSLCIHYHRMDKHL